MIKVRKGAVEVITGKTNATFNFIEDEQVEVHAYYIVLAFGRVLFRAFPHEKRVEFPWLRKASPASALTRLDTR